MHFHVFRICVKKYVCKYKSLGGKKQTGGWTYFFLPYIIGTQHPCMYAKNMWCLLVNVNPSFAMYYVHNVLTLWHPSIIYSSVLIAMYLMLLKCTTGRVRVKMNNIGIRRAHTITLVVTRASLPGSRTILRPSIYREIHYSIY